MKSSTGTVFRAKKIDRALADWKQANVYGQVIGVYRKCFNILSDDGRIVSVFGDTQSLMPLSIQTDICERRDFFQSSIQDGDEVHVSKGVLSVPIAQFECSLRDAVMQEMRRSAAPGTDSSTLREQSLILARLLSQYGKKNGEGAHIEQWTDFLFKGEMPPEPMKILSSLAVLFNAVSQGNEESIAAHFDSTVGAGIGLTPSADDVICGVAHGLYMFGGEKSETFLRALGSYVKEHGRERTTLVSAQQLELSSKGIMSDPVSDLLRAIAQNAPEELLKQELCRTLDYGSSSGTELCMGILAGCCLANTAG